MIVTAVRLLTIIWSIESRLVENAEFAKREPGWAGLAAMGIPKVHWLGWAILVLGSTLILIAGLWSLPNRRFNPTCAGERCWHVGFYPVLDVAHLDTFEFAVDGGWGGGMQ